MAAEINALSKAYDLTKWMVERVARFPKTHHYTIGQRPQQQHRVSLCPVPGRGASKLPEPESVSPRTSGVRQTGSRPFSRAVSASVGRGQRAVVTRPAEVGLRPNLRLGGVEV